MREGAIFLAAVLCALLGYLKGQALTERVRALMALKKIVQLLKGEIQSAGTPLPEAFARIAKKMGSPYRDFLQELAEDLGRYEGKTFAEVFAEDTDCCLSQTKLAREDLEEWKQFGSLLGYLDRNMQLATLEQTEQTLEQTVAELKEKLPMQIKLCRNLGILGGLFLVILLL